MDLRHPFLVLICKEILGKIARYTYFSSWRPPHPCFDSYIRPCGMSMRRANELLNIVLINIYMQFPYTIKMHPEFV